MIEIEDLKKMKLEDNDVLVFQLDHEIYFKSPNHIREILKNFFQELKTVLQNKFIVIPSSMKIGVINESEINEVEEVKPILFDTDNLNISEVKNGKTKNYS